jgi:DNA-binding transcriptional ArsR family regulator
MADHKGPDYELDDTLALDDAEQYKALFDETRARILELLLERAATIKELADTLDKPKGTIGHHVAALEEAGLIKVVRTKKVRAIEAKYYGRTARTFLIGNHPETGVELDPNHFLLKATAEFAKTPRDGDIGHMSTLRYARMTEERAAEWQKRLAELTVEFASEPRSGETTYGLLVAMYPTDRSHLPDVEEDE